MNLTPEQQELLSAYLDGEVTAAERAIVHALLERPEARSYLDGLAQYRELLARHTRVKVPSGFAASVVKALEGDAAAKPKLAKIHALPAATWRTPVLAAAAALVVAAGLFFTSSLINPVQQGTGVVARENTPRKEDSKGKPADRLAQSPPELTRKPSASPADLSNMALETERLKERMKGINTRDPDGLKKEFNLLEDKLREADEQEAKGGGEKDRDVRRARHEKADSRDELRRANYSEVLDLSEKERAGTEYTLVMDREAKAGDVYKELLQVGGRFGAATLRENDENHEKPTYYGEPRTGTDFTDYDGIEIELPESKVKELLDSLQQLSKEKNYGELVLPEYLQRELAAELRNVPAEDPRSSEAGDVNDNADPKEAQDGQPKKTMSPQPDSETTEKSPSSNQPAGGPARATPPSGRGPGNTDPGTPPAPHPPAMPPPAGPPEPNPATTGGVARPGTPGPGQGQDDKKAATGTDNGKGEAGSKIPTDGGWGGGNAEKSKAPERRVRLVIRLK